MHVFIQYIHHQDSYQKLVGNFSIINFHDCGQRFGNQSELLLCRSVLLNKILSTVIYILEPYIHTLISYYLSNKKI